VPNYLAPSLASALGVPLHALRGLADLPAAMDRNMRQTNQLMRESHEQLRLMREQAGTMLAQMRAMHATAEQLRAGGAPLVEAARLAREQMVATHGELVRMNEQLARLIRLGEPIERAQRRGERFGSLFRRAQRETGEGQPVDAVVVGVREAQPDAPGPDATNPTRTA
jgi:hypothetical protein